MKKSVITILILICVPASLAGSRSTSFIDIIHYKFSSNYYEVDLLNVSFDYLKGAYSLEEKILPVRVIKDDVFNSGKNVSLGFVPALLLAAAQYKFREIPAMGISKLLFALINAKHHINFEKKANVLGMRIRRSFFIETGSDIFIGDKTWVNYQLGLGAQIKTNILFSASVGLRNNFQFDGHDLESLYDLYLGLGFSF